MLENILQRRIPQKFGARISKHKSRQLNFFLYFLTFSTTFPHMHTHIFVQTDMGEQTIQSKVNASFHSFNHFSPLHTYTNVCVSTESAYSQIYSEKKTASHTTSAPQHAQGAVPISPYLLSPFLRLLPAHTHAPLPQLKQTNNTNGLSEVSSLY